MRADSATPHRRRPARVAIGRGRASRTTFLAGASLVLALGTLGAPASAASHAKVYVLNGIPGQTIDVCVGAKDEIGSFIRYGRVRSDGNVPAGTHRLHIREQKGGDCTGRKLYSRDVTFAADGNYTVVAWRPTRQVRAKVFTNDLVVPSAEHYELTMRHMARTGAIDSWVWEAARPASEHFFDPTFDDLGRGTSSPTIALAEGQTLVDTFPARPTKRWSYEGYWAYFANTRVYHLYLIGRKRSNMRVVGISQQGHLGP